MEWSTRLLTDREIAFEVSSLKPLSHLFAPEWTLNVILRIRVKPRKSWVDLGIGSALCLSPSFFFQTSAAQFFLLESCLSLLLLLPLCVGHEEDCHITSKTRISSKRNTLGASGDKGSQRINVVEKGDDSRIFCM
mmetsp:Transcript_4482/g.12547  ORF Transcript_4482/g.12547 Transcript_4482/m.12547 type:complete len:135 (-) Transcript_4482:82-486(-)